MEKARPFAKELKTHLAQLMFPAGEVSKQISNNMCMLQNGGCFPSRPTSLSRISFVAHFNWKYTRKEFWERWCNLAKLTHYQAFTLNHEA